MRNECTWDQIKVPSAWTHTAQQRKDGYCPSLPLYVLVIWTELWVIHTCPLCKSEGSWFRWCECDQQKRQEYYFYACSLSSVQFSRTVMSDYLWPHGLQNARPPCLSPTPRPCSNSCPLSWWCQLMMSYPLSSPSPPTFNLSQYQVLFQWVSSSHQVAKILEFQLQHQSFQWTPRTDLL